MSPAGGLAPAPGAETGQPLSRELLDRADQRPKKELIFREALELSAPDRGSLPDPLPRLRDHWRATRERLRRSIPSAARREYEGLTRLAREERQRLKAWTHPEAQHLHEAFTDHMVRTSEAATVIEMWFTVPEFDVDVQDFLQGRTTAEQLLRAATRLRKQRRARA